MDDHIPKQVLATLYLVKTLSVGAAGLSYQTKHGADQRRCGERTSGLVDADESKSAARRPGLTSKKASGSTGKKSYRYAGGA